MISDCQIENRLPLLTERLVDTYSEVGSISHLGQCPLPNYDAVIAIAEDLKDVLYPGYRRRDGLHLGNLTFHIGNVLDRLHANLVEQIGRALCYGMVESRARAVDQRAAQDAAAQAKAMAFLELIPPLRKVLALDVEAAFAGDPACKSRDEVIFCYPGLDAVTIHRLAHLLYELEIPLIPRMMAEWAHSRTGIDIHPGAEIGTHFFIDHGTGVVIGETAVIGQHVKLYQGVTLGALSFPTDGDGNLVRGTKRHPTIEDRVVIYANATVLGGATVIGHDSVIGSNAWITSSVAPHTTVSLEKPRLRVRTSESHAFSDSDWSI
jgi:serine O-acetyltransferase